MSENHTSALLVRDGANLSILTDAVLRQRVIARGPPPRTRCRGSSSRPVQVDRTGSPSTRRRDARCGHRPHRRRRRRPARARSALGDRPRGPRDAQPFALRHAILRARDVDGLAAVAHRLPQLFLALLDASIAPLDIGRVLALQVDTVTARLVELAMAEHGRHRRHGVARPGSTARREFTLGSDIENALAYDGAEDGCRRYFPQLPRT